MLVLDLEKPDYEVEFSHCDVRDEQKLAEISSGESQVDILVNNAGLYHRASVVDTLKEDLDRVVDTNLKGTYLCSCKYRRMMMSGSRGVSKNW